MVSNNHLLAEVIAGVMCAGVARGNRRRTGCRPRHLELLLLVIRLIRKQHADFAPSVEEQRYRRHPDQEDQEDYTYFDTSHLAANKAD